jgi:acyl carrier protein
LAAGERFLPAAPPRPDAGAAGVLSDVGEPVFGAGFIGTERRLEIENEVRAVLDSTLGLNGRAGRFTDDTPLLGSLPELDSMAVAEVLTALEEKLGVTIEDDAVDGSVFETFGALVRFAQRIKDDAGRSLRA